MDFGALPPEINSGRMYAGPGPGSMLAAATAWDSLSAELQTAVDSYRSVISGLADTSWHGMASASMAAAAAPYLGWLNATAAQAEQTAMRARAAAAAYESAFATTVPPSAVAANRAQLAALVATNLLGQNTPAIMATQAHYAEMWAQDAAAMYGYAGSSAASSTLTPFTPPKPIANPAGTAGQAAVVAQAAGSSAGVTSQSALSSVTAAVPRALQGLAQPAPSTPSAAGLSAAVLPGLGSIGSIGSFVVSGSSPIFLLSSILGSASSANSLASPEAPLGKVLGLGGLPVYQQGATVPALGGGAAEPEAALAGEVSPAATAGMGRAASLGSMSVPKTWAAAVPAEGPFAGTGPGAVPDGGGGSSPGMVGRLPMGQLTGRPSTGTGQHAILPRPAVVPRSPAVG